MDDRWKLVQELFAGARRRPREERRAWLEQATGDVSLRDEVLDLLAAASDEGFLRVPALPEDPLWPGKAR